MPFIARALTLVTILGAWFVSAAAQADPLARPASPEARDHLIHGNRLYGVRSFEEAVAEYRAGALIEPAPVFDYNLGQCFRHLGKYQEAIWHYERFLSRGNPQGELLDAVHGFIAQMNTELDKQAMTRPPPDPAPPPRIHLHDERPVGRTEAWYEDGFGWGLAGVGFASVAVGGGLLINAASLGGEADTTTNQQLRDRLKDKEHTRNLLGTVIGIGGAGLLATGVVKLAMYPKEPSRITSWNVAVSATGVMVFGKF
jgi:tetratricopeptide (TPR) repeat protein